MSSRLSLLVAILALFVLSSHSANTSATLDANSTATRFIKIIAIDHSKKGWISQPDGRGTIDILWGCIFTMFLCSWSILCLNVPGPEDRMLDMLLRKVYMMCLGLLGPEFIFQIALAQWGSARRSVREFHASGYTQWTIQHAFFADMGGFLLHSGDCPPFPIDAKQLHYLVTEGYVPLPTISKQGIGDRNKVDGLLRCITLIQTFWFILNMCGRATQNLAITCLELTTGAFIVCTIATFYCSFHKPADVETPEVIKTNTSIAEILVRAGDQARRPYNRTPLEFISRKEWSWSLYWSNWINILRNIRIVFGPTTRPINRFENTIVPELSETEFGVFAVVTTAFGAIFFGGWNYSFPTKTEQTLWRAASVGMMFCLVAFLVITKYVFDIHPALRKRFGRPPPASTEKTSRDRHWAGHGRFVRIAKCVGYHIRNNSVQKDPALDVPLKAILPIYVVAFIYCHVRTYIFIADILELRALPASGYMTVEWSRFIPHL